MRIIVKCTIPAGTAVFKDEATLVKQFISHVDAVGIKHEDVYFTFSNGKRNQYAVVESESKLKEFLKPLWLDWKAEIEIIPAMTLADFEKAPLDFKKISAAMR